MKKRAITIAIAIIMTFVMTLGLAGPVLAASPTQVIGAGQVDMTALYGETVFIPINFQATLVDPDTGEATGLFREIMPIANNGGAIIGNVQYLAVSEDGSLAWIGFVIDEGGGPLDMLMGVRESPSEISFPLPLYVLGYSTFQDIGTDYPDLFSFSENLFGISSFPINKIVIK